jgi:hypothetical protein
LCAEIIDFANATPAGEEHSVVLVGGWGGEEPGELMTHSCTFSAYLPGDRFCQYLIPNSSWEMGIYNAKRAFACLDSKTEAAASRQLQEHIAAVEVDSRHLNWLNSGVLVRIQFGPRPNVDHTSLTISARREPLDPAQMPN